MRIWLILLASIILMLPAKATPIALDWVSLPANCFQMGETQIYPEEAPRHEACVEGFDMTRTEVTHAQFSEFVEQTGYVTRAERGWKATEVDGPGIDLPPGSALFQPPQDARPQNLNWWRWMEGANWRQPEGPGSDAPHPEHPVRHVTRSDATAFAAWAGGRLPTETEWEYAARGGLDGTLLAWPEAEREARKHYANTWQGIFPVANTSDDGFADIAPVGSFPANGFGLSDMIGNVWEWTATPYAASHRQADRIRAADYGHDSTQPGIPVGTIKGGSYLCARSYCYRFRPAARQAQDLTYGTSHIGFRIVRDRPE